MAIEWLTPEEIANELKVSVKTVYKLLRAGELGSVKLGRSWRVSREHLNTFLKKQESKDGL